MAPEEQAQDHIERMDAGNLECFACYEFKEDVEAINDKQYCQRCKEEIEAIWDDIINQ